MGEARLDQLLTRLPAGLPAPMACWLVARVAGAARRDATLLIASDVRIREDGAIRVVDRDGEGPFATRPPETILGGPATGRSFVFCLGALLLECMTGRHPFERGSDLETRLAVTDEPVAKLVGRVAQATTALDSIVERALAKRPSDRFENARMLAASLDGLLDDELLEIGPEDLVEAVGAARAGIPVPRRPTPGPQSLKPVKPKRPIDPPKAETPAPVEKSRVSASQIARAELDLKPEARRISSPTKPRFDQKMVRLGDPLGHAGAGITEASVTGIRGSSPPDTRQRPGSNALKLDEHALDEERKKAAATRKESFHPTPDAPNWVLRIGGLFVALLALAIVYQFLLRPVLRDM